MKALPKYKIKKLIEVLYPELSPTMIANKLGISTGTVHKHISEKGLRINGDSRLYHLKLAFSKKKGYSNLAEAIGSMGSYEFHKEFREEYPDYKPNKKR